ncbi:hypothetical protein HGRIS_011564 [Hohenbuehelia grisea]|uniref:Uncharacterized protein n=1 Tax=Hohenbuehelia grisea TaxID=104357 RepID=A0ABR3JXP0_9AGAR
MPPDHSVPQNQAGTLSVFLFSRYLSGNARMMLTISITDPTIRDAHGGHVPPILSWALHILPQRTPVSRLNVSLVEPMLYRPTEFHQTPVPGTLVSLFNVQPPSRTHKYLVDSRLRL